MPENEKIIFEFIFDSICRIFFWNKVWNDPPNDPLADEKLIGRFSFKINILNRMMNTNKKKQLSRHQKPFDQDTLK